MAKGRKTGGRPTKLTPEIQERCVQAIRSGNYIEVAAAYAGITDKTYYDWKRRGEAEPESIYGQFLAAVKSAEALSEAEAVAQVRLASRDPKNWAAGMTWLERRFQTRWSRTDRQEHSGEVKIVMVDETSDKETD
jgi:hypothetical protein